MEAILESNAVEKEETREFSAGDAVVIIMGGKPQVAAVVQIAFQGAIHRMVCEESNLPEVKPGQFILIENLGPDASIVHASELK